MSAHTALLYRFRAIVPQARAGRCITQFPFHACGRNAIPFLAGIMASPSCWTLKRLYRGLNRGDFRARAVFQKSFWSITLPHQSHRTGDPAEGLDKGRMQLEQLVANIL